MPEGETYRIYLDAPAEPQGSTLSLEAVGAGLATWGIHELIDSDRPESSAKSH